MNLSELRDKAYQCAVAHGWHETELSNEHCLCLVISELMEAVEADRKGIRANVIAYEDLVRNTIRPNLPEKECLNFIYERTIKGSVEEELADVCIRLLDLAGLRNIHVELVNVYPPENISFAEFCYKLTGILSNPAKYTSLWLNNLICDTISWVFAWCRIYHIDIEWHIEQKINYNESRPYKHGKNY